MTAAENGSAITYSQDDLRKAYQAEMARLELDIRLALEDKREAKRKIAKLDSEISVAVGKLNDAAARAERLRIQYESVVSSEKIPQYIVDDLVAKKKAEQEAYR